MMDKCVDMFVFSGGERSTIIMGGVNIVEDI